METLSHSYLLCEWNPRPGRSRDPGGAGEGAGQGLGLDGVGLPDQVVQHGDPVEENQGDEAEFTQPSGSQDE